MGASPVGGMSRRLIATVAVTITLLASSIVAPSRTSAGILPVAVNDSYTAVHGDLRTVAAPGVLANDVQVGGGFTADLRSDVDHGTLDLDPDGGFTYRSDESFVGSDTFTYRVDGGLLGLSNTATVTITVTNDTPVAKPDAYSAIADVEKSISAPGVLGNDDDADGDDMTVDVVEEPDHGNLNEDDDGSFRYKADQDFAGTDTWRYRVWDGIDWSNTVTVTMTVSAPATPPPTQAPTPRPTSSPTPTPIVGPIVSVPPGPTLPPVPTLPPLPSVGPTPTPAPRWSPTAPTATAGATATASVTATPPPTATATDMAAPSGQVAPGGVVASAAPGSSSPPQPPGTSTMLAEPPFTLPLIDEGAQFGLDTGAISLASFEWAVPALVLTVPGILIVIAVLVESLIGLAWLRVARRWLSGDRRRRADAAAAVRE
jgi:hypothetical protein